MVVRVRHGSLSQVAFSHLAAWNNGIRTYDKPGIAYIFFAARKVGAGPERSAIAENTVFDLTLGTRAGVGSLGDEAFRRAYAALWLLTHLGGLGTRSRRGGGSLQVTKADGVPNGLPSLMVSATTPTALQAELKDGLSRLRQLVGIAANVKSPSTFDILHPDVCKIWVVDKAFRSWSEALEEIGRTMQRFRSRRQPDYPNVKAAVLGQSLKQPVQRAAFGLPIEFFYGSLYRQYQQQGDDEKTARRKATGTLKGQYHARRASPLLIRVTKLASGKCAVIITLFYAQLLPDDEGLKLELQGSPCMTAVPDLSIIEDFLNNLDTKVAPRVEVAGW